MKITYDAPKVELLATVFSDIITVSEISEAGDNATGYEDRGDISRVFKII